MEKTTCPICKKEKTIYEVIEIGISDDNDLKIKFCLECFKNCNEDEIIKQIESYQKIDEKHQCFCENLDFMPLNPKKGDKKS